MERKELRKGGLKWKILRSITIFIAVSMAVSALAGYLYFVRIVREQKISDEEAKQQQVVNQMQFMAEDIDNFAKSIIIDETLQTALEESQMNEFELSRKKDRISKRLAFYNSLKTYVASSFLELENGARYGSGFGASEEDYIERKFGIQEFVEFQQDSSLKYSKPYIGLESRVTSPVICCRVKIWDQEHFGKQQGTLYIEVYLSYFIDQMEVYGQEYENVCLLGTGGEVLFQNDKNNRIQEYIKREGSALRGNLDPGSSISVGDQDTSSRRTDGGYLISHAAGETGWQLYTLISNEYLWRQSHFVLNFFAISFVLSLGLVLIFTSRTLEKRIQPITYLSEQMGTMQYDSMDSVEIVHTGDEIQTLYECYQAMIAEIQRGIEERIAYEKQKKEMEFDIMLSQVNPHYLYNVLNTVVYLAAAEKNKRIVKIVNSLIYTLQETLNLGEHDVETTIEKELELTKCYLQIQEYRYPDMFEVELRCPEKLKGYGILKTSIQPLVENALLHGILPTESRGKIIVMIEETAGNIVVKVTDDGQGIADDRLYKFQNGENLVYEKNGRKHIGISNIRDRIEYLYGEPCKMEIRRLDEGGTEVVMCLPVIHDNADASKQ